MSVRMFLFLNHLCVCTHLKIDQVEKDVNVRRIKVPMHTLLYICAYTDLKKLNLKIAMSVGLLGATSHHPV